MIYAKSKIHIAQIRNKRLQMGVINCDDDDNRFIVACV